MRRDPHSPCPSSRRPSVGVLVPCRLRSSFRGGGTPPPAMERMEFPACVPLSRIPRRLLEISFRGRPRLADGPGGIPRTYACRGDAAGVRNLHRHRGLVLSARINVAAALEKLTRQASRQPYRGRIPRMGSTRSASSCGHAALQSGPRRAGSSGRLWHKHQSASRTRSHTACLGRNACFTSPPIGRPGKCWRPPRKARLGGILD